MRAALLPILAVIAISILMVAHLFLRAPIFPFSPDSANYIEQARSLIQSGLTFSAPSGSNGIDKTSGSLFPIGFPIILAFFSIFGVDAQEASIAVGWLSAILLPVLLYICFKKQIGSSYAAILAGLSVFSPGVLTYAPMGLTDIFSLVLAVGAIGLVLNSRSTTFFFVGGVVAGLAYAVRNAHIALLVALAVYFVYLWVSNPEQRNTTIKQAIAFAIGASVIILPLLLRNLAIFGALNPYEMEPSTVSVAHNVRIYIQEFIYDLSALRNLGLFVGWSIQGLMLLLALVIGGSWMLMVVWKGQLAEEKKRTIFLCITYSIMGAGVVIAARSRYEWGEMINIRHTLQYTPFCLAALLAVIPEVSRDTFLSFMRKSGLTLVCLLGILHALYALKLGAEYQQSIHRGLDAMNAYQNGKNHLCVSEGNTLLMSNWEYVFRIKCDARVQNAEFVNLRCDASKSSTIEKPERCNTLVTGILNLSDKLVDRSIWAGFFPGRYGVNTNNLPLPEVDIISLQNAGWDIVQNNASGLLLSHQSLGPKNFAYALK
ncbi:ArnT family glycosyltransferase [Candidatus Nitrotoga sp. HW29]|uniref:ArnT family glycosyltransferase n=1 Tax=Candidatus Nitrotoga sp. HW29 TaxID=2886963 RepID=UPI001EF2479D|nr:glycosyltransferase family 39 protein [Candidatus Nitrotoga sp. HW29]